MSKKVLFAYNGRIEKDQSGNYYGNELNDKLVERYLSFGDQVIFLVRIRNVDNSKVKELMPFANKNLRVVGVPDFASPINYVKNIGKVNQIIREEVAKSDVIISRLPSLVGREAISEAKKKEVPYLIEVVGCPWDALYNHSTLGKIYAPYAYYQLKKQVKYAPYVLYVTSKFLQDRYPSSGVTAGVTDVVLNKIDKQTLKNRIAKIEGFKSGQTLVVGTAAGYDVKFKGQEFVIEAISKLKAKGVLIEYRPVGKGTGQRLKQKAKEFGVEDQIKFLGQLKHSEVFSYIDSLDVYVQPSKTEGLPRSVIEAMSRACPVIGSSVGGIPELLDPSMIFEKGNTRELELILESLSKETFMKEAKRNFLFAKQFDTKLIDSKRMDFYNKFKASFSNE